MFLVLMSISSGAQSWFTVGSYNIRYDNHDDKASGNGWRSRSKGIYDLVNYERWDVFGAQEVLDNQMNDLLNNLDGYDYIGVGRNDGAKEGEYAPVFYRRDRMRCLDKGWFWISETPDVPGSKGWDADQCRICTWGKFEDKSTGWKFWFFNLHMDHKGVEARREGAKLVLSKIREMCSNDPYILTGDFNVDQRNEIYGILTGSGMLVDTYEAAGHKMAQTGTTSCFNPDYRTDERIDHIFVSPTFRTHDYGVLTYGYWNSENHRKNKLHVLSDHYPIEARVELPRLRSSQDWAQYRRYERKNKETDNPKVVFMGNSITEGWYNAHPEFFLENNYAGRGISGQVTAQMLARFRSDVINLHPETVVILAGTNDIAMNQGYVSIDHIFENIVSMAELAECNGIKVVLCSVLPADSYSWSWEIDRDRAVSSIHELNQKIKAYAEAEGHDYADYFAVMDDGNGAMIKEYQKDAVHPNKAGYLVMEEVIRKILDK